MTIFCRPSRSHSMTLTIGTAQPNSCTSDFFFLFFSSSFCSHTNLQLSFQHLAWVLFLFYLQKMWNTPIPKALAMRINQIENTKNSQLNFLSSVFSESKLMSWQFFMTATAWSLGFICECYPCLCSRLTHQNRDYQAGIQVIERQTWALFLGIFGTGSRRQSLPSLTIIGRRKLQKALTTRITVSVSFDQSSFAGYSYIINIFIIIRAFRSVIVWSFLLLWCWAQASVLLTIFVWKFNSLTMQCMYKEKSCDVSQPVNSPLDWHLQ